jgi:hypothetical protein
MLVPVLVALVVGDGPISVPPASAHERAHCPSLARIEQYRHEEGLDLDLAGHPRQIAARSRALLKACRDGERWARSSASVWGAPLRKVDFKLMWFRQKVLGRWNHQFEPWLTRHPEAAAAYAGYFANPEMGGWIYIGFTTDQEALVAEMKSQLHLFGAGLIRPFPYQPLHTEAELYALLDDISKDEKAGKLWNSLGVNTEHNKVEVTTTRVAKLRALIAERFGPEAPVEVEFGEPAETAVGRTSAWVDDLLAASEEPGKAIRAVEPSSAPVSNHFRVLGSTERRSKRTTGLEPATSSLGSSRSTN